MIYEDKDFYIKANESKNPWLIIFTKKPYKELSDMSDELRAKLFALAMIVEKTMLEFYSPTKINLASFGNELPRVHLHIIARFSDDEYFPNSMWGEKLREFNSESLPSFDEFVKALQKRLKVKFD